MVGLPWTDGREQSGRRPSLVVHTDALIDVSPVIMVVPFSSQLEALRFPACVRIESSKLNGLTSPSVAMGFQLRAADRVRFANRLCVLAPTDLQSVDDALRRLMDL